MTKVDIISGFLGAGKTTLIKQLIKEGFQGEKVVLIENEFGEIGIDSGFLKEGGITIKEMNSGCICCSLVGDFGRALKKIMATYAPDRIIIEPSGVGKLSDVVKAVENIQQETALKLNGKIAVVDAIKCKMYMKNFGEFFNDQLKSADCIILSRTQKISQEKLEEVVVAIKGKNGHATLVTTPWQELQGEKLLEAIGGGKSLAKELIEDTYHTCEGHHHEGDHHTCEGHHHHEGDHHACEGHHHEGDHHTCEGHHHHEGDHHTCEGHHHAEEVFTSWGLETPRKIGRDEMKDILEKLSHTQEYGIILRGKGILQDQEGRWYCFDMVPEEYEIREEAADYTGRLCIIGSQLNEEKLKQLFKDC